MLWLQWYTYIYTCTHTIYIYTYVFNFYSCFAGFNLLLICTGTKSQMCCIHYEKKYFTFLRWIYCRVRIIKVGYIVITMIFNTEMPIIGKVLLRYFLEFCFPINQIHYNYFFFFFKLLTQTEDYITVADAFIFKLKNFQCLA